MTRFGPVAAGWIARGVVVASTFFNTRLLIGLIGVDEYAVLAIVISLAPWLAMFNLGLPSTAQNLIVRRCASNRKTGFIVRESVNAACSAGILYLPSVLLLAWVVDRYLLKAYGAISFLSLAVLLWALILLGLSTVFNQILYAFKRGFWPSIAPAVQAGATTLCLILATYLDFQNSASASLALGVPMMLVFVISAVICGARLNLRIKWRMLKYLLHSSRGFLLFGLMGSLSLSCDYIIMSQLLQGEEITQYNLVAKTLSVVLTLHGVLLATTWSFLSDRYFRKDFAGVRYLLIRLLVLGLCLLILLGLPLAFYMNDVAILLTGGKVSVVSWSITIGWLLYISLRIWSDTFATALLSFNQVRAISHYLIWQSALSLLAQWVLGSYWGAGGIIAGISLSFLLTAAWILPARFLSAIDIKRIPA